MRRAPLLTLAVGLALATLVALGAWQWRRMEEKRSLMETPPARVHIEAAAPAGRTLHVFAVREGTPGWRSFTPVRTPEGVVFVDWAFTPGLEPPADPGIPPTTIEGVEAEGASAGAFTARAEPEAGRFYVIDLPALSAAAGVEARTDAYIAADYAGAPNPFPTASLSVGPERHLGYAITWWGLAAGLVLVYAAFLRSRARRGHGEIIGPS